MRNHAAMGGKPAGIGRALLCGLLALGAGRAGAASPEAAARKCRATIAASARQIVGAALSTLDACHKRRDSGRFSGDCNVISSNAAAFTRATARADTTIAGKCRSGNPALANYPDGVKTDLFPELERLVEESGAQLQGQPDIAGDSSTRKQRAKCHKAIGKARSGIIKEIVKRSTACQKKLDRRATTFGPLDASCVVAPSKSASKANRLLGKGCGGISGADVGSCPSLPACVIEAATGTGQEIARSVYAPSARGEARCGNGQVEGTEQCDDGNRNDADACRNSCTNATCGDGVLQAGSEECDDGNGVPNDGCTDCRIDGATCGAAGIQAIVSLLFDPDQLPVAGLIADLGYARAGVSIPGSLDEQSVLDRVQDLTGLNGALFVDRDTNSDGVDDTLRNVFATTGAIADGPFERVGFDCTPGAFIRPTDFDCTPSGASDPGGNPLEVSRDLLDCKVTQVTSVGEVPTTTTTTPTATTGTTASSTNTVPGPTTTTTTNPHTCGNATQEPPDETCDDGNTVDENTVDPIPPDACPANCRIETCPAPLGGSLAVNVNFSSTSNVAGYKVFVDYPEAKVTIPGSGQTAAGVIANDPTNGAIGNDLDYGLIVVAGGTSAIPPSRLFTINFTRCASPAPTAGEFSCVVKQASDTGGNDVPMTCSVSIP